MLFSKKYIFLALLISLVTLQTSIAGHFIIDPITIDTFLEKNLPVDKDEIWEDHIISACCNQKQKDPDFDNTLKKALCSQPIKNLKDKITVSFAEAIDTSLRQKNSLYAKLCTNRRMFFEEKNLSQLSLKEIKHALQFCLDIEQQPAQNISLLLYFVNKERFEQKNITTLLDLVLAIGTAVSSYYDQENLLHRLKNNDTAITSLPSTPVIIEIEDNNTITVASFPKYSQDLLNNDYYNDPRYSFEGKNAEPSFFCKTVRVLYALSSCISFIREPFEKAQEVKAFTQRCTRYQTLGLNPKDIEFNRARLETLKKEEKENQENFQKKYTGSRSLKLQDAKTNMYHEKTKQQEPKTEYQAAQTWLKEKIQTAQEKAHEKCQTCTPEQNTKIDLSATVLMQEIGLQTENDFYKTDNGTILPSKEKCKKDLNISDTDSNQEIREKIRKELVKSHPDKCRKEQTENQPDCERKNTEKFMHTQNCERSLLGEPLKK